MRAPSLEDLEHGYHRDRTVKGLELYVSKDGKLRTWSVRYREAGVRKRERIGTYPSVSLMVARRRAKAVLARVAHRSEKEVSRVDAQGLLLRYCEYCEQNRAPRTATRYREVVDLYLLPALGERELGEVQSSHLAELAHEMREVPGALNTTLAVWRAACRWGQREGYVSEEWSIPGRLIRKRRLAPRERVLTMSEISAILHAASGTREENTILLVLLTGQRPGEVQRATLDDVHEGIWTVPASRHKSRKPKVVPLTEWTLELMGNHGLHTKTFTSPMNRLVRVTGIEKCTAMDLRRTFATRMLEMGTSPYVVWAILGHSHVHKVGDRHYNQYAYLPEKKAALQLWSDALKRL